MARTRHKSQTSGLRGQRLYAFVDSVTPADPENGRIWSSIQLDAIDANYFDASESFEDVRQLRFARISTTLNRISELAGAEVDEGRWLELHAEREPGFPQTWLARREGDQVVQEPRTNTIRAAMISPDARQDRYQALARASDIAANVINATELGRYFRRLRKKKIRITALDVGQGACVSFSEADEIFGYFDVGAPLAFNRKSFPNDFKHIPPRKGFVLLSHWDFDHYALAEKCPDLKKLDWFAPKQPVGPNAKVFQQSLGAKLKFIKGALRTRHVNLRRCGGTDARDRNATGYALRIDIGNDSVLLTGDADYQYVPASMQSNATALMIPHHCGPGTKPPSPFSQDAIAVASYDIPNTYRHPNVKQLQAHVNLGWTVRHTAADTFPRSDKKLYPV